VSEQEIKVDIELLKKDVVTMSALLEKFDTTIDKMQEIASSLSRMVSLQEQRLENQEKTTAEMQSVLEMRRIETNNNIKDIYNRINTVNNSLSDNTPRFAQFPEVLDAWAKTGALWGGDWDGDKDTLDERRCDGMHWQFARLR